MKKIEGIITALATPFQEGKLDEESFRKLIRFQRDQGVEGFVINGTTGESPCLFQEEVEKLFEWTREEATENLLILGVGGNSTEKTLENIKRAEKLRADAVLAVSPYYNKPPQRGLIKHFKILSEKSSLPVILYNVPARTGVGLSLESVLELSQQINILGIKEASGDLQFGREIIEKTDKDFAVLSGDDETSLALFALGGRGVISVLSHILGKEMKNLFQRIKSGEKENSLKEYKEKYGELLKDVYAESNPIGIKMALKLKGIFASSELRSPLVSLEEQKAKSLKETLRSIGLL